MAESDVAVEVRGLGKRYARDFRRSQRYGAMAILSELNPRTTRERDLRESEFWAIRDVSFDLRDGEALGVIGRNGAGKSTLLRLVAGITRPDEGRLSTERRVSALLDPSSGFDPILSGRENIDVAFALIAGRPPDRSTAADIIEYAELGDVIDTPVRTFSRGMRLRLGFSVMVYADPDVLVIDEALAVGDSAFQLRCLEQLRTFCREGGSLLFVSHSLWLFQNIATRGIHLSEGRVAFDGSPDEAADRYLTELREGSWADAQGGPELLDRELVLPVSTPDAVADGVLDDEGSPTGPAVPERPVWVTDVTVVGPDGTPPLADGTATIRIELASREHVDRAEVAFTVWTADLAVCVVGDLSEQVEGGSADGSFPLPEGTTTLTYRTDRLPLAPGSYLMRVAIYEAPASDILGLHGYEDSPTWFEVVPSVDDASVSAPRSGPFLRPLRSIEAVWPSSSGEG